MKDRILREIEVKLGAKGQSAFFGEVPGPPACLESSRRVRLSWNGMRSCSVTRATAGGDSTKGDRYSVQWTEYSRFHPNLIFVTSQGALPMKGYEV